MAHTQYPPQVVTLTRGEVIQALVALEDRADRLRALVRDDSQRAGRRFDARNNDGTLVSFWTDEERRAIGERARLHARGLRRTEHAIRVLYGQSRSLPAPQRAVAS